MSRIDTGDESIPHDSGEEFGPYEVLDRIGMGGMATVHRAREHGIEGFARIVALKRLLPHLAESEEFVRSFVREAKLASQLTHPNIVQIFELGRVDNVYFISMELIEGDDLRVTLRASRRLGPPPTSVILSILEQLCDALHHAHTRNDADGRSLGLVHRDVSPSNVIVTPDGVVKVIDFGIAKATTQQSRTRTGAIKGKFAYLSPEGISGGGVDARSDVFATGILAHELLTARPLFARKNDYDTIMAVQQAPIQPPSAHNLRCPPVVDRLVLRALERDPDRRWQSARQMRTAIKTAADELGHRLGRDTLRDWVERGSAPPSVEDDDEILEIAWGGRSKLDAVPFVIEGVPDRSRALIRDEHPAADGESEEDSEGFVSPKETPRPDTPLPVRNARVFGEHLVQRDRRRWASLLFGVVLVAAVVGAVFLMWQARNDSGAQKADASIDFEVKPDGAIIEVQGQPPHTGSPHRVDLMHGRYRVSIRKEGYKSWVSYVDLDKGGAQHMRVVLEKRGSIEATVAVRSTPAAMPVTIDGVATGMVTPTTFELEPGKHTLEITLGTSDPLWIHRFEASADTNYEFHPTLSESRIRRHRRRLRERSNRLRGRNQDIDSGTGPSPDGGATALKSRDGGTTAAGAPKTAAPSADARAGAAKRAPFDAGVRRPYR